MPKIVVLDGFTLNPGDLNWDGLRALGDCTVHDRTAPTEVVSRCDSAEIVLTNKVVLSADILAQLPALRCIGVLATGYNIVDVAAAAACGIAVTNVPAYGTRSVAQHTLALLLELTNRVGRHADSVREGEWCRSPDWTYALAPMVELEHMTLGIVGRGRIGTAVIQAAEGFGMRTLSVSSRDSRSTLLRMFEQSDVISLHCPLTADNQHLIAQVTLAHCRSSAYLLNTARGGLIHEADLAAALNDGRLAGAALDVLSSEPPTPDNPLLSARNCLITPHVSWATAAARQRLLRVAVENVAGHLAGTPLNQVN